MSMLEIFLSKNDLEHIANGHDLKIKISSGRASKVDGIILKPDLINDTRNLLINYKYKLINTEQQNFANNFSGGAIRAWDKLRKRISVVDRIYFDTEGVQLRDDGGLYWRHFREVILMQSTRILDKNSQKIFEGDLVRQVRTQPTTENETITGVVTMLEGAWSIVNDNKQLASVLWSETAENEIIGNIFENQELLEDKE